jgi:hypothetical protein
MLYIAIVRYTLSIASYTTVVGVYMLLAAAGLDNAVVVAGALAALIAVHPVLGYAIGRWWAIIFVALLPLLGIPVPTATECGDGCEPWPMWFGMLYLGVPVGATLIAMGVGWRKTWGRQRSGIA